MILRSAAALALAVLAAASPAAGQGRSEVKTLSPQFTESATGMVFVLVKGGCYEMGETTTDHDRDEQPHEVCVDDFYMAKYEVTNAQFAAFVDATGYRTTAEAQGSGWGLAGDKPGKSEERSGIFWRHPIWPGDSIEKKMDHPVVQVSWADAKAFAKWLSERNSRAMRLPYEAEWEYAARSGGRPYRYSWGNGEPAGNVADRTLKKTFKDQNIFDGYTDGYKYTAPVGKFPSNELTLHDMTGNVWEWCEDWYEANYYEDSPRKNPRGPQNGLTKVDRGGSWNTMPRISRAANRDDADPTYRFYNVGFRLVVPVTSVR